MRDVHAYTNCDEEHKNNQETPSKATQIIYCSDEIYTTPRRRKCSPHKLATIFRKPCIPRLACSVGTVEASLCKLALKTSSESGPL